MMAAADIGWENIAGVLAVLAPLVGIPVAILTIHLRTIRDAHAAARGETARHIDALESGLERLRQNMAQFERDCATKEEWLREAMAARHHIERLSEAIARLEAQTEPMQALAKRLDADRTGAQ